MQFLDLDLEDVQLDTAFYSEDARAKRIEFQKLGGEINTASIRRWHTELTAQEITQFEQIAGKQLTYYGYM